MSTPSITTHEVFNQPAPLAGYNLFETNHALRDALRFNAPQLDTGSLHALGAALGTPDMQAHARLANVRGDRLVFVVDAPVWHAKLRLAAPGLVDAARSIGLEVNDVGVKTTTAPLRPLPPATARRPPMSATAQSGLAAAIAMLQSAPADSADAEYKAARRRRLKAPAGPAEGAS